MQDSLTLLLFNTLHHLVLRKIILLFCGFYEITNQNYLFHIGFLFQVVFSSCSLTISPNVFLYIQTSRDFYAIQNKVITQENICFLSLVKMLHSYILTTYAVIEASCIVVVCNSLWFNIEQ